MNEGPKARILVVEDEKGIRSLLHYELSRLGYLVDMAQDGEEGVEKVRQEKYDIVISDIIMPKVNGLQALKLIKKISPETEVVMITGYATVENALQSMKDGAYGFIQKPFNLQEIFAMVEKALEKSELKTLIALYESSSAVFSTLKLEKLLPMMVKLVKKVIRAEDVALLLFDHQKQLYMASASFSPDSYQLREFFINAANQLYSSGKLKKNHVIVNSPIDKDPLLSSLKYRANMKAYASFQIALENKVFGVLSVTRIGEQPDFSQSDTRDLSIFVSQMSQSIANTKLFEQLEIKISELEDMNKKLEDTTTQLETVEKKATGSALMMKGLIDNISGCVKEVMENADLPAELKNRMKKIKTEAVACREKLEDFLSAAEDQKD